MRRPSKTRAPAAPLSIELFLFVDRHGIAQARVSVEGERYDELVGPLDAAKHIGRLVFGWLAHAVLRAADAEDGGPS